MNKHKRLPKNLLKSKNFTLNQEVGVLIEHQSSDIGLEDISFNDMQRDSKNVQREIIEIAKSNYEKYFSFIRRRNIDGKTKLNENESPSLISEAGLEVNVNEKGIFILDNISEKEQEKGLNMSLSDIVEEEKESSVISGAMVVRGDIDLDTSLLLSGKVFGNIKSIDVIDASFGSYIEGNIEAKSMKFTGSELIGNVSIDDYFESNFQTKISGNINAKNVEIAGTVKGEIKASESVLLKKTAVVIGDIYSALLSIEAGAKLDGKIVTSSNGFDVASIS